MSHEPNTTTPPAAGRPRDALIALLLGLGGLLALAAQASLAAICSPALRAPLTLAAFVLPVAAITLGTMALRRHRHRHRPGAGLAAAGLVMGALPLSASLLAEALAMTTNSVDVTIGF